jgi:hypothetical protein
MSRAGTVVTIFGLCALPASASAQAAANHWSALYTGPLYVVGALLLIAIGLGLSAPGWNRLGIVLWLVIVTAGACLSMWALPGTAKGELWQLPAMVITLLPFLFVAEHSLRNLQGR